MTEMTDSIKGNLLRETDRQKEQERNTKWPKIQDSGLIQRQQSLEEERKKTFVKGEIYHRQKDRLNGQKDKGEKDNSAGEEQKGQH